jgi:hypothetical protein
MANLAQDVQLVNLTPFNRVLGTDLPFHKVTDFIYIIQRLEGVTSIKDSS